jgi:hypothetical protein
MHIDFQPPYAWQELNDKAEGLLGVGPVGGSVKVVAGARQALVELALGLARQFPHKKKIYFFRDIDPTLEAPVTALSREGCTVHGLDANLISDPERLGAAIETDTLMVLVSEDDPMLGKLNDLAALESLCESKKFYLIRVSHFHHRFLPLTKTFPRHVLRVNSVNARLAIILSSARTRWPIQFAESTGLPPDALDHIARLTKQELVNPAAIEKFEARAPEFGATRVFPPGVVRVPDRAIVYWPDMDGYAVMVRLAEKLRLKLPAPGEAISLESTSLNRWGAVRTMDWLRGFGFTDEMIRGTLIIDQSLLDEELIGHLKEVRREILAIQGN